MLLGACAVDGDATKGEPRVDQQMNWRGLPVGELRHEVLPRLGPVAAEDVFQVRIDGVEGAAVAAADEEHLPGITGDAHPFLGELRLTHRRKRKAARGKTIVPRQIAHPEYAARRG